MRYAGIIGDDFVNGQGVCVSFWTQGCPYHCRGCHNPQTWSFDGGIEASYETIKARVMTALHKNGVERNFSILGGEPLCEENLDAVERLINDVRADRANTKIWLWTGATLDELYSRNDDRIQRILDQLDVIITGRFELERRDITLPFRGSTNQQILYKGVDF